MTAITKITPASIDETANFTVNTLTASGNVNASNANLGNAVTANFFLGNGSFLTGLPAGYTDSNVANYLPNYTGNISANYFIGNGASLTSIVGANVTGFVPNANIANTAFSVSGANVSSEVANANYATYSNTAYNVSGSNVSGQVGNALVAGSVYTNAQPNITSVGTLTSLDVTGNVNANFFIGNGSQLTGLPAGYTDSNVANYLPNYTGNLSGNVANLVTINISGTSNLGNIANITITGGSNGQFLKTDGNGVLSWANSTGGGTSGDVYFDSFTANGVQTAFTIAQTPSDKKYISVFIDSTYQPNEAYTLAGNTVTFVEAPDANSAIEIRTIVPGQVASANIATTANVANLATLANTATVANTVTVASQPNITSIGNLTSLTMAGNITPATTNTYSIGNSTHRFKDLFLEGNTIYLGDRSLSADDVLPFDLTIAPEVLTINANGSGPGNDIHWVWTWTQSSLPYARVNITNQQQTQVPLYKQGTYQVNNFANEQHGNLDQRHMLWLKWVDGAGLDNLVSWATNVGNVTHSHPNINNGANTTVQRLNISVPATITIPTLNLPSNVAYNVAANGSGAYSITGSGVGENRNIGPLYRGATYTFNLDTSLANHPFYITTDNGTGFVSGQYVGEYLSGVTGSRGNGQAGYNTLTFTVPQNAPDVLYYQCGNHAPMRGAITIRNLQVETNVNGNPILYFQHGKEGHKTPVEIRPIPALVNQMCLVYDATTNQFVPQDMATYVENTPTFKNKIQEVAGTATLIAPDGLAVVPTVLVVEDVSYLPLVDNNDGDLAFDSYTNTLYIWRAGAWRTTKERQSAYINFSLTDAITPPVTGTAKFYPPKNVLISKVYAHLSTATTSGALTFIIKKNGVSIGTTFSIAQGTNVLTPVTVNVSVLTTDYLTLDVTGGSGATDLFVKLEYIDA